MNLKIDIQNKESEKLIVVDGEIDAYTAPELRTTLLPLTERKGDTINVNLQNVGYMDSTGLGVFIGAYKSCQKNGSYLKISGMSDRVKRLFEITGLTEILDIDTTIRGEA